MVKYPLWIQKILYYTIRHEGGRHIDFRQSLSPRQTRLTTARRLSAHMSSRALATTTASSWPLFSPSKVETELQDCIQGQLLISKLLNYYLLIVKR